MIAKTDKHQYYFQVQLNWQEGRKGILTANDVKDVIRVATPPEFSGGVPDMWSAEHLLLSALSSSFMTTYLTIAEKEKLAIAHFECSTIGQIGLVDEHLEFININLFPKIYVDKQEDIVVANEVLTKTYKQCIIANSIKAHLIHHGQVLLNHHAVGYHSLSNAN
ncbi:OsmC family protein [Ferruginibacter sp. SUN106]|uniref:OsmC family protein n=1 Tax=Ferruginibacter sp. SUN106 TaxID=2978348 RepID=UPI003D36D6DE